MQAALDLNRLTQWLSRHLPGFRGPLDLQKYSGGQSNPTYLLTAASGRYVLRRKPDGALLRSAHAVDREYRVQRALMGSAVPVARMHVLCDDESIIGTAFYIMAEVRGVSFDDPRLPGLDPAARSRVTGALCQTLAAIHEIEPETAGLSTYGAPGDYIARQTERWTKQYRASETDNIEAMDALIRWLNANRPAGSAERRLVHGDYRLDNLLFDPETQTCLAVLDWELSTIGHPYADLAGVIMQWSMPPGAEGRGLAGVDRTALGLWSDQRFIDSYCAHRGLGEIEHFGFYLAFSHFRMAAILQGVKKRALDGTASDPARGLRLGAHVAAFAEAGLRHTR